MPDGLRDCKCELRPGRCNCGQRLEPSEPATVVMPDRIFVYRDEDAPILGLRVLDVPDPAGLAAMEPGVYSEYVSASELKRLTTENERLREAIRNHLGADFGPVTCSVCGVAPPDGTPCACFSVAALDDQHETGGDV